MYWSFTYTPAEPKGKIDREALNETMEEVRRSSSYRSSYAFNDGAGIRSYNYERVPLIAKITGYDVTTGRYSWTQQYSTVEGSFGTPTDALEGNVNYLPAYELVGNPNVPNDVIVQLMSGDGEFFLFSYPVNNFEGDEVHNGDVVFNGTVDFNNVVNFNGGLGWKMTHVTWSSQQNDYALLDETTTLAVTLTGDQTLTGIEAPDPPYNRVLWIINIDDTSELSIAHLSGSSTTGNLISCPRGRTFILKKRNGFGLQYDVEDEVWRFLDDVWRPYYDVFTDTLTGTVNNYAGDIEFPWWILSTGTSSDVTITGIVAPPGAEDGYEITISNEGTGDFIFSHNSGSSTAGNRIITPDAASWTITPTESATLRYYRSTTNWRIIDRAGSSPYTFTAKEIDGSPSSTTELQFPNDSLTTSGGAVVLREADLTHPGLINTADQSFSGIKDFRDQIVVGNSTDGGYVGYGDSTDPTSTSYIEFREGASGRQIITLHPYSTSDELEFLVDNDVFAFVFQTSGSAAPDIDINWNGGAESSLTTNVDVTTPTGTKTLHFTSGILTSIT